MEFGCSVFNTGSMDGDEVVMVYHSAGEDVRSKIGVAHPVPTRSLIGFERVHVPAGKSVDLKFQVRETALMLVNATGGRQLYEGSHRLVFSRGHGVEVNVSINV